MAKGELNLSERQCKILVHIAEQLEESGYPPTIREIGNAVGISSTSVVNYHLNKLKDKGLLDRDDRVSRGLKLTDAALPFLGVPLALPSGSSDDLSGALSMIRLPILGQIAAGLPISVMDDPDPEDYIAISGDIVGARDNVFALHVKGDSMIDALIHDGDIVVMQQVATAENGAMVAAWIKDREETTLKRIYHEGAQMRLQPANPLMPPIYERADNVEIQGRVIAVIRRVA